MTWEPNEIYTTESHIEQEGGENSDYVIMKKLDHFFRTFRTEDGTSSMRDQIQGCLHAPNPSVTVSLDAIMGYDNQLGHLIFNEPERCLELFEQAVTNYAKEITEDVPPIQILLTTNSEPTPLREIDSNLIKKLIVVPGLVISTTPVSSRATEIKAVCSGCGHILTISCKNSGFQLPRKCQRPRPKEGGPAVAGGSCPLDPYTILPDNSTFTDYQFIKIQEAPEDVPPGEMPRHISASVDRALSNNLIPGTRKLFVAILQMMKINDKVQKQVLRIVGIVDPIVEELNTKSVSELSAQFPNREAIIKAFAPEIYGMQDVKEAICCQLFSGVRKNLPDGMKIRGDINVLLLGDPSVAKSQLLKFAHSVTPIGVYTSGKGSSAAGLTATVVRAKGSGEFFLEGGAMVLADGGLVCIDEFDKMREDDRVAIHEAMEQQTISIAKAGITAVLNTRTAVLAAANPVSGRFDDLKTARDNVDFQTTILSRFDLIFVLRDVKDEARDRNIAEHVLKIHTGAGAEQTNNTQTGDLKKFIQHVRAHCNPSLGDAANNLLKSEYVQMRSQIDNTQSIPITVRQLEALIRVTESLAKMEQKDECKEEHVREAIRLFKVSTFNAASTGILAPEGPMTDEQRQEVNKVQDYINRRCPLSSRINESALIAELKRKFTDFAIVRVIQTMLYRGEFEYCNNRRSLKRARADEKDTD
ncbi:MCM2/3/5 family protein [Trichomonas vaginalis G3]|uniref:DNA replication licensing factor MCM5 n=1 Tax=Trichomonas vaginalis (strain ATCC PRA-98 / G3) TaxID=412133 RepID=A2FUI9_TRIV3|nr:DNA replication licensing factor MCM family member family [Trichomonas vaginalis G3]EAX91422.1 MCM2/3/5 family protein [Trichomonas vaginalis G3]KAI5486943.1 DNA replication licensing factor MCM family member family [Trichomonas vaginalis G3]|eukprot:XP_001304352.1 MCM2/3/5 family protein [Trichomonas vaginalis G3]